MLVSKDLLSNSPWTENCFLFSKLRMDFPVSESTNSKCPAFICVWEDDSLTEREKSLIYLWSYDSKIKIYKHRRAQFKKYLSCVKTFFSTIQF